MGRLFWKFFFFILLAQVLATLGIGGAIWVKERAVVSPEVDAAPPAIYMVTAAELVMRLGDTNAMHTLIHSVGGRHQLYVVDETGRELFGRNVNAKMVADARRLLLLAKPRPVVRQVRAADGHEYLLFQSSDDVGSPHQADNLFPGAPLLGGLHNPGPVRRNESLVEFAGLLAAIMASLVFAALLAWYFAKPIKILRGALQHAGGGDFRVKAGPAMGSRRDELADLGHDFDKMADQLTALMSGQRNLLHDVSHELRSPLARMQAAIGLARQQPERAPMALERIERESMRMDRLIEQLLTLSRLEAGVPMAQAELIAMDELLAEIIEDARFEAQQKSIRVLQSGDCHTLVQASPELLYRALENVIRNAIKYSQQGSDVRIDAQIEAGMAAGTRQLRLSICDTGPGVAPANIEHIFKPFFRGDHAAKTADGHGLGLAIAQRVVHAVGGTIGATNRSCGGLCVTILLPAPHVIPARGASVVPVSAVI